MSNKVNNIKYSFIAKFWHWGFVLLFIYGVAKQVDEIDQDVELMAKRKRMSEKK